MRDQARLQEKIDDSRTLISKAIVDLRDLSRSINTDYIREIGLLSSIQYELSLLKKTVYYETFVETEGVVYRLEPQKELILFRIFQEAINNIIKHAECNRITVRLSFQTGSFIMRINDNGKGFATNYSYSGIGLANMKNRATIIGGQLHLSTSDSGTEVKVVLPV
jgi:two-component system NarL family sensor kinase